MTLGDAYARGRPNALNVIRLALAVGVILWHSFPLTGTPFVGGRPLVQLLGYGFVDGFFVISGFLITRSWLGNPSVRTFLSARASRILPAFWVCLLVTAFVLAPLGTWLSGGDVSAMLFSGDAVMYVVRNWALWIFQYGIDGTPSDVPFEGVWNGSLWTLSWEFICYLGILVLGRAGLLRSAWPLCIAFGLVWVMTLVGVGDAFDNGFVRNALRFALVFLAGAVVARIEHRIVLSRVGVALAFVGVAVSLLLPDYRLLAAPALAYGLIGIGGLLSTPRLAIRNDISYGMYVYAFPVQQLLASAGLIGLGVPGFWVVASLATVPLAAASWFLVERPVIRLNRRLQVVRRPVPDVVATP